jgi:hypothetical protein
MRIALLGLMLAAAFGAAAATARGDGLPVPVDDTGGEGIAAEKGVAAAGVRYVSLHGGGQTVVA